VEWDLPFQHVQLGIDYTFIGILDNSAIINRQCWPPTQEQIVSALGNREHHTNKAVGKHLSDPSGPAARGHGGKVWEGLGQDDGS
jgi:hypothetical protein